jgi:hypothetical protein
MIESPTAVTATELGAGGELGEGEACAASGIAEAGPHAA